MESERERKPVEGEMEAFEIDEKRRPVESEGGRKQEEGEKEGI